MKKHLTYRFLIAFSIFWTMTSVEMLHGQVAQSGLVQEYHGTNPKTPLGNVSIAAANAGAVVSDAEGNFTLNFRTLHAGDAIQFRRVELAGYEVMNQEAIENARIANHNPNLNANPNPNPNANSSLTVNRSPLTINRSPLTIVMARRETLQKLRDGYRSVAVQRYEQQLKASEEEIERLKQEGKLAEEQYKERMNALEEEYENKLSQLETYIDKFARIDLSDLDNDEQQIISLVQDGKFDKALELYDKQNLADRLRQSREEQQKLTAMRDQLSDAATQKAIENQRLRQSIDRQITLLYMAGGEANLMRAHDLRHQVFLADTTHLESRLAYAVSLWTFAQPKECLSVLQAGLVCSHDSLEQGRILSEMGTRYWNVEQYEEALQSAQRAYSLLYPWADRSSLVSTRLLPAVVHQLLIALMEEDKKSCAEYLKQMEKHWEPDTLNYNSLRDYILLLNQMSDFHSRTASPAASLWDAREAIRLSEIAQRRWPWFTTMLLTSSSCSYSLLMVGERVEARCQARVFYDELARILEHKGTKHEIDVVCPAASAVVDALLAMEDYALTDSLLQLTEQYHLWDEFVRRFATEDALLIAAQIRLAQSRVLLWQGRIQEAEPLMQKALQSIGNTVYGATYIGHQRPASLARLHAAQGLLQLAETEWQEAIAAAQACYAESQDAWDADNVCIYLTQLASLYQKQGNRKGCSKMLKEAERYAVFPYDKQLISAVRAQQ